MDFFLQKWIDINFVNNYFSSNHEMQKSLLFGLVVFELVKHFFLQIIS